MSSKFQNSPVPDSVLCKSASGPRLAAMTGWQLILRDQKTLQKILQALWFRALVHGTSTKGSMKTKQALVQGSKKTIQGPRGH